MSTTKTKAVQQNKKMKKLIGMVLLAITLCTCVQAQSDTNINPLSIARAFALQPPTSFNCRLYANAIVSNEYQSVTMVFGVRKSDFAITNLSINGTEIPLPEPIYSLPLGADGVLRDVYLNVTAYDKGGNYAGHGYTQESIVSKDDTLVVLIRPADRKQEIPVDVAEHGSDIQLIIENFDYGYGYGVTDGKFYAYLPPVGGKYHYILKKWGTGEVIGSGWIEPFKDATTPDDAYFGIRYEGNVLGIDFPNPNGFDDWIGVPNAEMNCSIPTDGGSNVLGKVMFTDADIGRLEVRVSGNFWVYIQKVTETGEMPFLVLDDYSVTQDGWTYTTVVTKEAKVGKVVISIVPKDGKASYKPWVNIHRFYGTYNGGNGSGMGKPAP